ncbi:MAG: GAF domain-containing protein [Armatimonadetes bacterium]|nr:GAF domain-containing protein [Armatimonadota bacterium]
MIKQEAPGTQGLQILYEVARIVNSTLDLGEVLEYILSSAMIIFEAEAGSVMLLDSEGHLTIESAHGLSQEVVKATRIRLGEGIAGWVAKTGEPLLLDGKVKDPRFTRVVDRQEEIKSSLCAPLRIRDKIIGVLMLRNPTRSEQFTREHLRFLEAICDHVAIAIENARLFRSATERAEELDRLNRAVTHEKLKIEAILESQADGVILVSPSGKILDANAPIQEVFGKERSSLMGMNFAELVEDSVFSRLRQQAFSGLTGSPPPRYLDSPESSSPTDAPIYFHPPLNPSRTCQLCSNPVRDADGQVQGIVVTFQDITELRRIDQMKSDFVSLVTHELKTPITSIQGFVDLIMSRELPRENILQYLAIVRQESGRLLRLINNILNLSKLEAGLFHLRLSEISLPALTEQVLESMRTQVYKHNFNLIVHGDIPPIQADKDLVIQILSNLLSNAIKYSPGGGEIRIEVSCDGEMARIGVSDRGVGIPREKLSRLFEKFYRGDHSVTKEVGGTGLGLANVKFILDAHKGTLSVDSEEGKGTTFTFALPVGGKS